MKQIRLTAPETPIDATVHLPSSKSICNRALIIRALTPGCPMPGNLSDCDDTQVLLHALQTPTPEINIGAAGTAMRFLTALLASTPCGTHLLTGTERMQQRPIRILADALRALGADIDYAGKEGYPPLRIIGKTLQGGTVSLPGNVSSQYISALLLIAPTLAQGLTLTLTDEIVSLPYIDLTLGLMRQFGAQCAWVGDNRIRVEPQPYRPTPYFIESDWSAASYWYEIMAFAPEGSEIALPHLQENSLQGDAEVEHLFGESLNVETKHAGNGVTLQKTEERDSHWEADFVNQPDLAQTFVVACALLGTTFSFTGLQSLKIKETDRITALVTEMKKLGYVLTETDGRTLSWDGTRCTPQENPVIDTYDDHRMAMAFAPAAFKVKGLRINHPEVVSKSYPHYWDDLHTVGFTLSEA